MIEFLAAAMLAGAGSVPAWATEVHRFDIPEEDAAVAVRDFGTQAHVQILVAAEAVRGKHFHAVSGDLSTEQGLDTLLDGSGLAHQYVGDSSIALLPVSQVRSNSTPRDRRRTQEQGQEATNSDSSDVAQDVQAQAAGVRIPEQKAQVSSQSTVEEVIVTAEKKNERLQDVPVAVTAIAATALTESNQLRLEDYYSSVPGLSLISVGNGETQLQIRGISSGSGTNPTVGITIDDVPYGSSSGLLAFGSVLVPDIDPSVLSRIEVLRGPQGTLYGASSIGGLLKYVTTDPSTEAVSGRLEADGNTVYHGEHAGYAARGAVNVPLSDTLAVRASGFARRDPGYIDDPILHIDGVNRVDVEGAWVSALWRPSQAVTLKLSALTQATSSNGISLGTVAPGLGDLQQTSLRGTGPYDSHARLYWANFNVDLGIADLTAISGYGVNSYTATTDETGFYGGIASLFFGVKGAALVSDLVTRKFTQEIRLSSRPDHEFLEWLAGAFYTYEHSPQHQIINSINPLTGAAVGSILGSPFASSFAEYAAFADVTVHFTKRFDVQLGGRESRNRQIYNETDIGPLVPLVFGFPSPLVTPTLHSKDKAFTYLVTPRFRLSPDLMLYARLATGYRPGGPNPDAQLYGLPTTYRADKTRDYEVGIKGSALAGGAWSFDASAYYIDWNDIQLGLVDPISGAEYNTNASSARSRGLELLSEIRPLEGLTIGAWAAWNDAVLTRDFPNGSNFGVAGDRLPFSSRFSGNISVEEELSLCKGSMGFLGVSSAYVGNREGDFPATPIQVRAVLPAYAKTDAHVGVRRGSWRVSIFLDNISDKRGALAFRQTTSSSFSYNYIQPRTIGMSAAWTF